MVDRRSLSEFAKSRPTSGVCWCCLIPESDEVNEALRTVPRLGAQRVAQWLVTECGYDMAEIPIRNIEAHKQSGHHRVAKS